MDVSEIKNKILPILKGAGVKRSAIFGSTARGAAREDSDVDILVELPDDKSLLDFVDLKIKLEEAIKKKVDLVEYDAIKPALRNYILNRQVPIL